MADFTGQVVSARRLNWGFMAVFGLIFALFGAPFFMIGVFLVTTGEFGGGVFALVGGLFSALGLIFVHRRRAWARRLMRIRDIGQAWQAEVTGYASTGVQINNVSQYKLELALDGQQARSGMHPMAILSRYPVGTKVTVYVDPDQPGEMVWEGDCGLPHRATAARGRTRDRYDDDDHGGRAPTVRRG